MYQDFNHCFVYYKVCSYFIYNVGRYLSQIDNLILLQTGSFYYVLCVLTFITKWVGPTSYLMKEKQNNKSLTNICNIIFN